MMKIHFIQTGGTIDKAYPMTDVNHGYNFEIGEPAFMRVLPRTNPDFEFTTETVTTKDSTDLTDADRASILAACEQAPTDKIIITHGTDTMAQTAVVLAALRQKTIILTGSLRPETFKDSDADFNLGLAVAGVMLSPPGVYVAMNGLVLPWDQITFDRDLGRFTATLK